MREALDGARIHPEFAASYLRPADAASLAAWLEARTDGIG
jgi:hypothetical protein